MQSLKLVIYLRVLILLILYAQFYNIAFSQDIQIKSVNENEYPLIKVAIEPVNLKNLDFSSLFIIENKDSTSYSVDSVLSSKNDKAICFLIDQDLTIEEKRNNIVHVIKEITKSLGKNDYIDVVLTAEKKAKGSCIYPLSFEFSDKPLEFIDFLDIYFTSANFTLAPKNMNCSIEQTLDFLNAKKNIPIIKYLIIISKIPYAGGQDWKTINEKAKEYGILYQWFSYTSQAEFEQTYYAQIQDIIKLSLDSLDSYPTQFKNPNIKSYTLKFYTTQNDKLNQFEIDYHGVKIRSTFETSDYMDFFKKNSLIIGITSVFFVLILSFIANLLYTKRQMAISIKELKKNRQNNIIHVGVNQKNEFDSLKTQHGSSVVIPSLSIEIEEVKGVFVLNKLINTIGRHVDNDLVIDDLTISSRHATLIKENGAFYIQDNESTNGTFVNDIRVKKSAVKNGDIVRIGKAIIALTI